MAIAQVAIGDPVVVHPGVYILHGQVVIDGFVEIHSGARDRPVRDDRAAVGRLRRPDDRARTSASGPAPRSSARCGSAQGAKIGANAVVVDDVPDGGHGGRRAGATRRGCSGPREARIRAMILRRSRGAQGEEPRPRPDSSRRSRSSSATNREEPGPRGGAPHPRLRHEAGAQMVAERPDPASGAEPAFDLLPEGPVCLRSTAEDLTPEIVRAGILRTAACWSGASSPGEEAEHLVDEIDRSIEAREAQGRTGLDERRLLRGVRPRAPLRWSRRPPVGLRAPVSGPPTRRG